MVTARRVRRRAANTAMGFAAFVLIVISTRRFDPFLGTLGLFTAGALAWVLGARLAEDDDAARVRTPQSDPPPPLPALALPPGSNTDPARLLVYLLYVYEALLAVHEQVQMDTPEDKALHACAVDTFRDAAIPVRAALPHLAAPTEPTPRETP